MTHYTVYKTIHKDTGKFYIGKHQTNDPNDDYMGSGILIGNAIAKYGKDSFVKEVLFIFGNEHDMNAKEAELVTEEFCLREDTYNMCPGGHGGWGYVRSNGLAEMALKELRKDPEFNQRVSENISKSLKEKFAVRGGTWVGKTHSDEAKKKISEKNKVAHLGSKNSQFGTMWITNGVDNAKVKKDSIIPDGWRKGMIVKPRV